MQLSGLNNTDYTYIYRNITASVSNTVDIKKNCQQHLMWEDMTPSHQHQYYTSNNLVLTCMHTHAHAHTYNTVCNTWFFKKTQNVYWRYIMITSYISSSQCINSHCSLNVKCPYNRRISWHASQCCFIPCNDFILLNTNPTTANKYKIYNLF